MRGYSGRFHSCDKRFVHENRHKALTDYSVLGVLSMFAASIGSINEKLATTNFPIVIFVGSASVFTLRH